VSDNGCYVTCDKMCHRGSRGAWEAAEGLDSSRGLPPQGGWVKYKYKLPTNAYTTDTFLT
jgi:hypothetical protein